MKTQNKQILLSVVMPALNEEKAIAKVIAEIPVSRLKEHGFKTEIIVVDGKSTDRTAEIAKSKGAKVVTSERGYGAQYMNGFRSAKGEIIATGDSDATYPFEDLPQILEIFQKQKLDFLTTNRFAYMDKGAMGSRNKFGNWVLTSATNILFGIKIKDSQSGMWIFKKEILNKLKLKSKGMAFSQELKIEAAKRGFRCKEVPIRYKKRIGKVKLRSFRDGILNLIFLFAKRIAK
jgi:glycosyltransferase involved in cell wall biosynthesis